MKGIGYSYQGYEYYRVGAFWRIEKDGNQLPERFGTKIEVKKFIDVRIKKAKSGLKPGASLPTSARQAQIMVQMSIMAKAKLALEKLKISIYEIDLIPTDLKAHTRTYHSTAAHILFADGRKKDRWGSIHEEKKIVYID